MAGMGASLVVVVAIVAGSAVKECGSKCGLSDGCVVVVVGVGRGRKCQERVWVMVILKT
jgi:hypothetical protein